MLVNCTVLEAALLERPRNNVISSHPSEHTATPLRAVVRLDVGLGASRAVGLANGSNPVSIVIPCHRVIGSDGSLTGYGGGLHRKEWLLKHEGAMSATQGELGL